ncbi:hypothetical protein QBC32DRAFT_201925 [Pseudoneurospora amorphoporcata]|uniref:Single-strand DNA deaminase toxin A-like C-terminal domain-containing protein n=1 Tax=Pseudoneurospora amorphoporcata TaxID=241081 RepID=A0AAN6P393_9PEZI|nr:hypothetical protein QBC32DRAFT_201925 [Pseudoneurospora amorphoporcata]
MNPSEFMTKALGLQPIHEAILGGDLKRVKRILCHDKNTVNSQSKKDQVTPLHLAILTGSLTAVKLLLLGKASFSIKDQKGYSARQYARSAALRARKLHQYERLGWQPTNRRNKKARLISTIFREPEALRAILSTNDHPLSGSTILTNGKRLTVLRKVVTASLAFPVQNSTCGFIASYESTVPQMMAVSGWKSEGEFTEGVLPNAKMTALVRYACQVMEFKLYMQPYDCPGESVVPPEHVGRYMASHVEKQLSTAWVLKLLQDFLQTSDLARMAELKHVELPPDRAKAKVFLNHSPCGSCLGYLAKIRRVTGVTFAVETIPFTIPGSRAKPTVCANCGGCSNPPPIQPEAAGREPTPAAEADTAIAERDGDYEELDRQQRVDDNGPMVDFGSLVNGEDNEVEDELPVQPTADKEVQAQEEAMTPSRPNTAIEATGRQVVAVRRRQGLLGTSPPGHWEVFQGENFCAKPLKGVRKRLGLNKEEFNQFLEAQSPRRFLGSPRVPLKSIATDSSMPASLLDPISTINGRSDAYPRLSRPPASSHLLQRLKMGQSKRLGASMIGSEKPAENEPAATGKLSLANKHIRPSKIRQIQERSVFAKVVRRHQEKRQHQQRGEDEERQELQEQEPKPMRQSRQFESPRKSPDNLNTRSQRVLTSIERTASVDSSRDGFSRETPICVE